jgi:hypothetical protein
VELIRKEGGIRCGMKGMKKTNERSNEVESDICEFLSKFCEKELKERRKEKGLSQRERKEMREAMWEMEEEGGGDVVIHFLHHLNEKVRDESRKKVDVCGYVEEREKKEEEEEEEEQEEEDD